MSWKITSRRTSGGSIRTSSSATCVRRRGLPLSGAARIRRDPLPTYGGRRPARTGRPVEAPDRRGCSVSRPRLKFSPSRLTSDWTDLQAVRPSRAATSILRRLIKEKSSPIVHQAHDDCRRAPHPRRDPRLHHSGRLGPFPRARAAHHRRRRRRQGRHVERQRLPLLPLEAGAYRSGVREPFGRAPEGGSARASIVRGPRPSASPR